MRASRLIRRLARRPERSWAVPSRNASEFRPAASLLDPDSIAATRSAFQRTYLTEVPRDWLESRAGADEVDREIVEKYELCRRYVVPWVGGRVTLEDATLVEIGCGTGAKTAAFAQHVGRVVACDHSPLHLEAARGRVEAVHLDNVELRCETASALLDRIEERGEPVDIVLLFAVLEHMTLAERLEALERGFAVLRAGGLIVVAETPNRLLPWDWHSSRLPFFNQLPDELAIRYFDRSPRADYVAAVRKGLSGSEEEGILAMTRQGRGVSYHEFELALDSPLEELVVGDGYDPEMVDMNPVVHDELALKDFVERERLGVPLGFTRYWLDLLIRKP
jgi:ubiquinone/menaquinone biosynthesis C-methylase UbiE